MSQISAILGRLNPIVSGFFHIMGIFIHSGYVQSPAGGYTGKTMPGQSRIDVSGAMHNIELTDRRNFGLPGKEQNRMAEACAR
jgi:hypothetical protein